MNFGSRKVCKLREQGELLTPATLLNQLASGQLLDIFFSYTISAKLDFFFLPTG